MLSVAYVLCWAGGASVCDLAGVLEPMELAEGG